MAVSGEMLMNADGLVVNAYQDAEGRGSYFPGSAGTSEGQFLFIIGNLHAYKATGNLMAKEAAEKALKNVLRVVYRNMPVPDAVDRTHIFAPHWLFNVKYPFDSSVIRYDLAVAFTNGAGYITVNGDKVRYVFGARSLDSALLWNNPYSPLTKGTAYAVASNVYVPGIGTKVTLTTAFTGTLYVTHSTQTGRSIGIDEPFEAWPDWRKLDPGEVACAVDVFVWAYRAFSLAAEVFNNPTWAQAAEMTRQQAAIAFDINDSRDWIKPTWTDSAFASGSRFQFSARVPAPQYTVDDNGNVVMTVQAYASGAQEVQYGNASVSDVYGVNDTTVIEVGASEATTVIFFIDLYQQYSEVNRYIALVNVSPGGLQTVTLTRANFVNSSGTVLPAGSPVYTFGVASRLVSAHSITIGRVRQTPARSVPYYPGAVPFTANFQGVPAQLIDWRGPVYMGYQSPYMWRVIGNAAAAQTDVNLLSDSQVQWRAQTGQPGLGPFVPVFIFDRADAVQYGAANTFGWNGPDPNTKWGGYQYRPIPELLAAASGLAATSALRISAIRVANNFLNWLAQDRPWMSMQPSWSNKAAELVEASLALGWHPMPVVPLVVEAFAVAINRASAHDYTAADTVVPMLPSWNTSDYPYLPTATFPARVPLGPPTDFPKGPAEINYPEPHLAALILRSVVMLDTLERPAGNSTGVMRVELRALVNKCMAVLEALWKTQGVMAGTFSPNNDAHEWYGFWHGEILDTLALVVEWSERSNVARPSIAAEARTWITGMLRWAKANTQVSASPYGSFPWRLSHNWRDPVTETFEYSTSIYTAFSGKEQRSSQRIEPRRTLSLSHTLTKSGMQTFDAVLRSRQNKPMLVPQWHLAFSVIEDAPLDQTYLVLNSSDLSTIEWGAQVAVAIGGAVTMLTVANVDGNRLNLAVGLTVHVPVNAKVTAVYNGLIDQDTSSTRSTASVMEAQVTFSMLPQEDGRKLPDLQPSMTLTVGTDTREVIVRRPNWVSEPTVGMAWDFNVTDFINGPVMPVNGRDAGARTFQARWSLLNLNEINRHLGLVARLHGQRFAAWMPSWTDDFTLTRDVTQTARLYVEPNAFLDLGLTADPVVGIFVRLRDGTSMVARVSSVVLGATECILLLDRSLPQTFTMRQVGMLCMLYRVRQVSDTSSISWLTNSVAETTVAFVTVHDEP